MAFFEYELDLSPESKWNMISATATAKNSLMYMQEIGHFFAGPRYFTTREGYDSFLIKYTLDGCGQLEYNGKSWSVPQGSMYWVDCKKHNRYRTCPETGSWDVIWVHFWGGNARMYYDTYLKYNNGDPVMHLQSNATVGHILQALLALDNSGNNQFETDLLSANLLTQLVSECALTAMRSSANASMPQIIQDIQVYLQRTYSQTHSLEELGIQFNLNPFYLQKLFKRHIGQSPNEYCIYLRIAHAKEQLRTTHKSVSEIAYSVGVDNLGYFTRLFKKHEGLTPQEYRQLWPVLLPAFRQNDAQNDGIPIQYQK